MYALPWRVATTIYRPHQGERMHCIVRGWLRYYGTQWVPELVWLRIKMRGL